jgi:predicted site-specific integrase-resolvase
MRLLGRQDLATFLGISRFTLRNWIQDGYVKPTLRSPTGKNYWSMEDAQAIKTILKRDNA